MTILKKTEKRNKTAKELAELTGLSERTIIRYYAQPREEYEQEAASRRKKAYELRQKGLAWKDIADKMGATINAAKSLAKRYKQQDLNAN